jgi:hypothetical protein
VLIDGSRNPTIFAAYSLAIAEDGVGCSPSTRAARAVENGGLGAAALKYLDEDKEAEDPAPTAEGDDGEDDSREDEKPAPEDDGDEHQAKRQACLARLGAPVGSQIQVCMFSLPCYIPNPPQGGLDPSNLFNIVHLGFVGREHGDFVGGGPLELGLVRRARGGSEKQMLGRFRSNFQTNY